MKKILPLIALFLSFFSFDASAACVLSGSIYQCETEGEAFEVVTSGTMLCKAVWGDISAGAPETMGPITHDVPRKRFVRNAFGCKNTSGTASSGGVIVNWGTSCSAMGALPQGVVAGAADWDGKVCYQGCQYHKGNGDLYTYQFQGSSKKFATAAGFTPTGVPCATIDPAPKTEPECVQHGTLTQCLREDGSHCAKGAAGTLYCWSNKDDVSDRVNPPQNEYATRRPGTPSPPAAPPNTTPPSTWNPPSSTATTTITNNNTSGCQSNCTTNYNTNTGTGSNGGPGGPGGPGTDPPDPDGEGEGTCDPAKETCAPGSSAAEVGDLYTESDASVASIMSGYTAQASSTPLITAASGFLTYTGGGSCPAFNVPATDFWPAMNFNYHCAGDLAVALQMGGFLILAIAAFQAFRIAFY